MGGHGVISKFWLLHFEGRILLAFDGCKGELYTFSIGDTFFGEISGTLGNRDGRGERSIAPKQTEIVCRSNAEKYRNISKR